MSDTWGDIQALKNKQTSLREKLARRRKERQEAAADILANISVSASGGTPPAPPLALPTSTSTPSSEQPPGQSTCAAATVKTEADVSATQCQQVAPLSPAPQQAKPEPVRLEAAILADVERHLLLMLSDLGLTLPTDAHTLAAALSKQMQDDLPTSAIDDLLQKFAAQGLITISNRKDESLSCDLTSVESVDQSKLCDVSTELSITADTDTHSAKRKHDRDTQGQPDSKKISVRQVEKTEADDSVESLLLMNSAKEKENKKLNDEILQLLSKPTAKEQSLVEKFKSQGGAQVKEFCPNGTRTECMRVHAASRHCDKLHFRKIIHKHTDESLGDCSFLNTCFHMDTCKYVHYEVDYTSRRQRAPLRPVGDKKSLQEDATILFPPQWVQCDLRNFEMSVLGKFAVVMADPPWDIHMELPYGTMSDDEMRKLNVPVLQDDGYIFLWVTGRAMELGRDCLNHWGYTRIEELIWVKTNQLQRLIRTGRTGHWMNHGKEHCLVGMKGNPKNINRGLDCDVIVAEVRATSHKPDEIYGIIERLSPGMRKIELFGRPHNVQPNWVTLGNQVDGVKLLDPDVVEAFKKRYPDGDCLKPS